MEGDGDLFVSWTAIVVVLLGALLGIIGAYMIWDAGGVLLFGMTGVDRLSRRMTGCAPLQ
jgi:hypothetical protein